MNRKSKYDMIATYRVDNRNFDCGDIIEPQNAYQGDLDENRKMVEMILEQNRPSVKPKRNEILMLFEEFETAKRHWLIQTNSKFYRTNIPEETILHLGDYNKVEELFKSIKDIDKANEIAKEYWNSEMTSNPKVEIFVESAIIEKIIDNSEEVRLNTKKAYLNCHNPKIKIITTENS